MRETNSRPKRRTAKIEMHVGIGSIFVALLIVLTGAIVWNNDRESSAASMAMADRLFVEVGGKVEERIDGLMGSVATLARIGASMRDAANPPDYDGLSHKSLPYMLEALDAYPALYSLYVGYRDGTFLQVIAAREKPQILSAHNAPAETRFIVRSITSDTDGQRHQYWRFLDPSRLVIGSHLENDPAYDPRKRQWYDLGMRAETAVFSDPYIFNTLQLPGITASRFVYKGRGVFGVDVTLANLTDFLTSQQVSAHSVLMLFDARGRLLADSRPEAETALTSEGHLLLPDMATLTDPLAEAVFHGLNGGTLPVGEGTLMDIDGVPHLVRLIRVGRNVGLDYLLVAASPVEDFLGHVEAMRGRTLLFSVIILVVALPLVLWLARRISAALDHLVADAERIRRLDLQGSALQDSVIREVATLSEAFEAMKGGLRTFGRYVPKALVEQIIQSGGAPVLGGRRQPLTVMFTDIADFTAISEGLSPEDLMLRTSTYFEVMERAIAAHNGVVDKYIGDAVMALWNAPREDPDHIFNACRAALSARAAEVEFNREFNGGFPPFHTRFGLHSGEAVVGNVGSSDRMNYTAIGATVNMASRLEGLNKAFGTCILISDTVREAVGEAVVVRPVDKVLPVGAETPMDIYELCGLSDADAPAALKAEAAACALCADWARVYAVYLRRDWDAALEAVRTFRRRYPDDRLAAVYESRCNKFIDLPPPDNWNGVTRMDHK